MSIAVALEDLPDVVAKRGADAYLVTVRDDRPHVVSVQVVIRGELLVVAAGRRTAMNIVGHPVATLLWPLSEVDPKHTLLVDGTAAASDDGEWLLITPTSAILHRAGGRRRRRLADGDEGEAPAG